MIRTDFSVEPASWSADEAELHALRHEIFVVEQGVPEEEEIDEFDAGAAHVIARDAQGHAIGTGRLIAPGRIGRMAVLREWRGRGVGEAILRSLLERARERHLATVEIHAQSHALAFYEKAGFVAFGEPFDECGIMHRHMRIAIAAPVAPPRAAPAADASTVLASTDAESARAAVLAVIRSLRRELVIFSRDLEAGVYGHPEVLEALKHAVIAHPNTRVRILVLDPQRARSDGNRLIDLAQRLSSIFAFRTPTEEVDRQYAGCYLASDGGAWFERPLASRFDGEGSSQGRARVAQWLEHFNPIWERAEPTAELRELGL